MNESKNVRKNVSMMFTGMVIGAALTGGSIAVAAGITAEPTWQPIFVDGQQVEMQAYNIAGHNYVKLRDMGEQVGFNVYWNAGVQIDTGHPYTGIAPATSGIRVSSYKGSTLRPGDRSGLNISPSADIKSVVSTQPNVIRVEDTSGFWTAIAVSSGTADVIVADQHGQTAALTLTVVDDKQSANVPESGASQTDAARQEIVRLVNQVRRENGVPELSWITGTGCMLGMICATYLAVTDPFTAALSAAREFGTAGERAEKNSSGPGSFQTELFDQFYNLL